MAGFEIHPTRSLAHARIEKFCADRPDLKHALLRFLDGVKKHEKVTTWKQLLALKPMQAERLQLKMTREDGYAVASVKAAFSAARSFYRELLLEELLAVNPLREVKVVGGRNIPSWNVLPQDGGAERLLQTIHGTFAARDRAVIAALLDHGFRAATLCSMSWGKVSERPDGTAVISFATKRGKQLTMKLKPRTVALLKAWAGPKRMETSHPLICRKAKGVDPLTRFVVYRIVKRWTAKLGLQVTPHGLRATFISDVIRRKGIEAARQLAGHSNIETTVGYSRWVEVADD